MYGHKLEELNVTHYCEELESILRHCPNIKKLDIYLNNLHFSEDKEFLPKLEEFHIDIESEEVERMMILSVKYSKDYEVIGYITR